MYKRSNSVVNVNLYMESVINSRASAASTLPLILHEFPVFAGFSTINPSLSLGDVKAIESNDMIPIIKKELKNRIQFKRIAEGKDEFISDLTEKPKADELTAEEKEKMERRREQNRMAARRFREKKHALGTKMKKKTQNLESENTSLRNQIRELRRERDILQRQLQGHMSVCHYVLLTKICG